MKAIIRASLALGMICFFADFANAGVVVAWGGYTTSDASFITNVPSGNDYLAVAGFGSEQTAVGLALRSDGSIAAWGNNERGVVSNAPSGYGFTAIGTGYGYGVALRSDGFVTLWGDIPVGPGHPEDYTAISAGSRHWMGLTPWGTVQAFGEYLSGELDVPFREDYIAISAGSAHFLALTSDGSIVAWGRDDTGQVSDAPTGSGFSAIDTGFGLSLALTSNGSIVAWGRDDYDQVSRAPSDSGYTSIAAGSYFGLALRQDGSIKSWGLWATSPTVTDTPTGTGFTNISTTGIFGLAIRSTVPFPDAGEDDVAYVDGQVDGLTGEQTIDSAIVGDGGMLTMPDSGTLNADDGITVDQGGTLSGGGTINGDVTNNGTVESDGGVFYGDINNTGNVTSNGGEHYGDLTNSGTVTSYDGYHEGNSTNTGTINSSGGVNNGDIVNYGDMFCSGGGVFNGTCINYGNITCTGYGSGGGTLINYGTINFIGGEEFQNMDNQGDLDLGSGAFTTEFDGDFSQSADGSMLAEIGGYIQGEEYDFIHVTGSASLEGSIDVSLIDGFSPNLGDAFTIMTADSGIAVGEAGLSIVGDGCFSWRIVDGTSLQLVSVPEPATFSLLAMAAVLLAGFWRLRS